VDAGDPEATGIDQRLSALAAHDNAGHHFESPWQLVRFGQLQGVSDDEAVPTLAAWCKRQGFEMSFVTRQVGSVHVVCLVPKSNGKRGGN
jgi:hypothetical protein